ncbi:hypothetical protein DLAC_07116 [Tieghemostelium lacteum]|uniref:Brl1/Brr6 domain-containing protein n=1 Tax=Tieghemostelium lacteum TaxID=361077 RepID=A0A151ZE83_TIELA|nr:hypothetical protein DLAC_07116 [Tieghemostelium lacteum]|eukprot:KYQ92268.1 hypothetical protein DLAC_07116 [Tieghemostelium lacteum]
MQRNLVHRRFNRQSPILLFNHNRKKNNFEKIPIKSKPRYDLATYLYYTVLSIILITATLVIGKIVLVCFDLVIQETETRYDLEFHKTNSLVLECKDNYFRNKCDSPTRKPIQKEKCDQYQQCMDFKTHSISKLKLMGMVLADGINSFADHLSYKSLAFLLAIIFIISRIQFSLFKFIK